MLANKFIFPHKINDKKKELIKSAANKIYFYSYMYKSAQFIIPAR